MGKRSPDGGASPKQAVENQIWYIGNNRSGKRRGDIWAVMFERERVKKDIGPFTQSETRRGRSSSKHSPSRSSRGSFKSAGG